MKAVLLALAFIGTWCVSKGQNDLTISTDFLTRVNFDISEARIPNYLVGVIYERPVQKGLSSEAILSLYRANQTSLNTTQTILSQLNITQTRMFSINGLNYTLELFNWTFSQFYTTLTANLNLTGQVALRNALIALQIDADAFSSGLNFGQPDPWTVFIQGNFTLENLQAACNAANITLEVLWEQIRNLFLESASRYEVLDFVQLLINHGIGQSQALIIWNVVPVTVDHVYSLPVFNQVITNFSTRVNSQTALGVLISPQEVVIHREIHDIFIDDRELLDIWANTLVTRTRLNIGIINHTIYHNLVVLRHNVETPFTNLTTINVTAVNSNLTNCSYVTFQNNAILVTSVPTATFVNDTYEIPRNVITNVFSGSALVCNNTLFGLVRGVEGEVIIADAFSDFVAPASSAQLLQGLKAVIFGGFALLLMSKSVIF
ncbi:uncharacterized protein LOC109536471 [Dendroctonus ponderosae]|uniref:uncharacterized protein LOC109536471 n=1 Tax=Dendroctonus ponderosae TaxID=77166 RepID=UPI0020353654|nr:uncharacterized protein LOC109536471 [Dendroctonus ponderosae]XP_019758263.2 uncharacterized protein LOC109536471 [Dendroctonus ponderosae]KAH1014624.1 hypothetical protein HUJ05_012471 [Dendroctonus ponderosae]